jgi:riboflavin synthase
MFTGLVQDIGQVVFKSKNNEGYVLGISSPALVPDLNVDDSVAVNGVCQTVTLVKGDCFYVQAVKVTLDKTTLGSLNESDEVNLELAMKLDDRLGGHIVQGHSNGKSLIKKIDKLGYNYILTLRITDEIAPYITQEGSVSIDGISLTIASLREEEKEFSVSIIPHTWNNTILKNKKIGDETNIEVDILAKYIERLLFFKKNKCPESTKIPITEEWLRSKGF